MEPRTVRWLLAGCLLGVAYLSALVNAIGALNFEFWMIRPSDYEVFLKYFGFSISGAFLVLAGLLAWKAMLRPAYIAVFASSLVFLALLVIASDSGDLNHLMQFYALPILVVIDVLGIYLFWFNERVKALFEVKA